ncbi:site-specific integrase [Microbacterium esteraromaticum]|uniref:tyrosine-type recombinase/integrase n=1 Tax=Microbacterium esteraromaticum TaxID=57043 RepID=UPI002368C932|nr:site-specific integrase [Microbacterium esteraromaticum]WDH77400.1 site-specific integrase [Microbacterium esteraromaticum]
MARSGGVVSFFPAPDGAPDPDDFLARVLDGWGSAMTARGLGGGHIKTSRSVVLQLCDSCGKFPWEWSPGDVDEWLNHLRGVRGLAHSTVRRYQGAIEGFCDYATSPAYDWSEHSARLFGQVFGQVVTEFNRVRHVQGNETRPEKRPFTLRELQQLFDLADLEFERVLESGRKGALSVLRDAAAFKIAYAWGLRVNEVRHLQVVDFSPNARAPYFGDYGNLHVRFGKSKAGRAFKPRNVLTVFEWSAEVVDDWIHLGLPRYGEPLTDLFPTGTGGIVAGKKLWARLDVYLDELGFPPGLDFHSLRRAYATNLLTVYGFDLKFVQFQLGHEHAATTSIYTLPAADFQVSELARVHAATLKQSGATKARLNRRLRLPPLPPPRPKPKPNRGRS